MRLPIAAAALALCAASPANAYLKAGPAGYGHWLQGAIAPLDGAGAFSTPAAAYSLRKLKSAYTGPAIRLRRASDNAEADINFLGFTGFTGAPLDTAAANAHCAATTCFIATWYDQSGNARHWVQATAAAQPQYVASCVNGLPCARSLTGNKMVMAGSVTAVMPASLSAVAMRNVQAAQQCFPVSMIDNYGNQIFIDASNSRWVLWDSSSFVNPASTAEAVWHSAVGVINGASSVLNIDGVETTGAITGQATAGSFMGVNNPGGAAQCNQAEAIIWNAYALTAAERTALVANQRNFWGF